MVDDERERESVGEPLRRVTISLDWGEAGLGVAQHVNQILGQVGPPSASGAPDGIYLVLGSIPPPVILSTDDEETRERLIHELTSRPAKVSVLGRFHMSRELLDDLIRILQTTARQYDAARAAAPSPAVSADTGVTSHD